MVVIETAAALHMCKEHSLKPLSQTESARPVAEDKHLEISKRCQNKTSPHSERNAHKTEKVSDIKMSNFTAGKTNMFTAGYKNPFPNLISYSS